MRFAMLFVAFTVFLQGGGIVANASEFGEAESLGHIYQSSSAYIPVVPHNTFVVSNVATLGNLQSWLNGLPTGSSATVTFTGTITTAQSVITPDWGTEEIR